MIPDLKQHLFNVCRSLGLEDVRINVKNDPDNKRFTLQITFDHKRRAYVAENELDMTELVRCQGNEVAMCNVLHKQAMNMEKMLRHDFQTPSPS